LNAEKEEESEFDKLEESKNAGIKRDFYLNEAMSITVDYLQLNQLAAAGGVARGQQSLNGGG
jgi:hypothetical protein